MKRFQTVGGGAFRGLLNLFLRGCKNRELCYNSDVGSHYNIGVLIMKKVLHLQRF